MANTAPLSSPSSLSSPLHSRSAVSGKGRKGWRGINVGSRIAAALIVLSLGLPWYYAQGTDTVYIPGWYAPGLCYTHYDYDGWASTICDPGFISPGFVNPGTAGSTGAGMEHSARFGLVFALVTIAVAARTGRRRVLLAGATALALVAGISAGFGGGTTSGVFVAWMAIALLIWSGLRDTSSDIGGLWRRYLHK
jgi:hypothetical protein